MINTEVYKALADIGFSEKATFKSDLVTEHISNANHQFKHFVN
jgi:hypothetical protein